MDSVMFVSQPGAQYSQKPSLYSPSKAQAADTKQVDDLGMDMSRQGKRWFPFSDGPRNCVGQALAKMNMAATFAQLYSHFSFQLADEVCLCMCLLSSNLLLLLRLAQFVHFSCKVAMHESVEVDTDIHFLHLRLQAHHVPCLLSAGL